VRGIRYQHFLIERLARELLFERSPALDRAHQFPSLGLAAGHDVPGAHVHAQFLVQVLDGCVGGAVPLDELLAVQPIQQDVVPDLDQFAGSLWFLVVPPGQRLAQHQLLVDQLIQHLALGGGDVGRVLGVCGGTVDLLELGDGHFLAVDPGDRPVAPGTGNRRQNRSGSQKGDKHPSHLMAFLVQLINVSIHSRKQ